MTKNTFCDSIADDLLTGAKAIHEYLGPDWPPRRIYYAAARGHLPIEKVGATLVARKSRLNARIVSRAAFDEDSLAALIVPRAIRPDLQRGAPGGAAFAVTFPGSR